MLKRPACRTQHRRSKESRKVQIRNACIDVEESDSAISCFVFEQIEGVGSFAAPRFARFVECYIDGSAAADAALVQSRERSNQPFAGVPDSAEPASQRSSLASRLRIQ